MFGLAGGCVLSVVAGCSNDPTCVGGFVAGIRVSVRAANGSDLVNGTTITAVRNAAVLDSMDFAYTGAGMELASSGLPGEYRVRVKNPAYTTTEKVVTVPEGSGCVGVVTQDVSITLSPAAASGTN